MAIGLARRGTSPDGGSLDEAHSWVVACFSATNRVIGRCVMSILASHLQVLTNRHIEERGDGRTDI